MPHKKFQHLLKCLAIYLAQQNKKTERKQKRKREKDLPGHSAQLIARDPASQPSPLPPVCLLPRRGKQLTGAHADAGATCLPAWRPSLAFSLRQRDAVA